MKIIEVTDRNTSLIEPLLRTGEAEALEKENKCL